MAKVRVVLETPIYDGISLVFKAPCSCSEVDGLIVYYRELTEETSEQLTANFVFKDAHGNTLTGIGNLFNEGAYVKVILDTNNNYAYIQNADTNGYLEGKLVDYIVEQGTSDKWTYRKWNSGIAECWAEFEGEIAVSTPWPNQSVLYYGLIGGFNYPIAFKEKPVVSVDLDAQDSWCNKYQSTITETGNIYAVGPVNKTESYTLNIMAKGRWK